MVHIKLNLGLRVPPKGDIMSNIKDMVEKNMSIGDIVISDNIYYEFGAGVSLQDLATKYGKTVQEVKDILKSLGVIAKDEKEVI